MGSTRTALLACGYGATHSKGCAASARALWRPMVSTRARPDATRLGRQVGDRTTLDLRKAENDASSAELTLPQARVEYLMHRLRLAAGAGRLDGAWLPSVHASLPAPQVAP